MRGTSHFAAKLWRLFCPTGAPDTTSEQPSNGRGHCFFNRFIVAVSLFTGLIVLWYGWRADENFHRVQSELARRSVAGAADQIALQISELKRTARIFVEEEWTLLQALLNAPFDAALEARLRAKLAVYFPEMMAYALADDQGWVQVEELDDLIGATCRSDLFHFSASGTPRDAYIHPNPDAPHFDIVARIPRRGDGPDGRESEGSGGIFFVSFSPETLVRILRLSEAPGHDLVLLRKDKPNLVELTTLGPRGQRPNDGKLTPEQTQRILSSDEVEGTLWQLVDLADAAFFERLRREIWSQTAIVLIVLLILAALAVTLLNRLEYKRRLLEVENRKLAAFFRENPNPVLVLDAQGNILFVNPAASNLVKTLDLALCDVLPHDYAVRVREQMRIGQDLHNLHARVRGRIFTWEMHPIGPLDIAYVYGCDITERIQAEERAASHLAELAHAGRLSTMGEMATGLAHELNQPLAAIRNYIQGSLLRLAHEAHPAVHAALESARDQADRAAGIIQRLRELTRKQKPGVSYIDVNALINTVLKLAGREIKQHGIRVTTAFSPEIPAIRADRIQIEQVLLNLVRNAVEALRGDAVEAPQLRVATGMQDDFVWIRVEDNGCGLRLKDSEKIFDAFYTTKPEGMGMGLSISRTIIETHQGKLWAEPAPTGGAYFHVWLPAPKPKDVT